MTRRRAYGVLLLTGLGIGAYVSGIRWDDWEGLLVLALTVFGIATYFFGPPIDEEVWRSEKRRGRARSVDDLGLGDDAQGRASGKKGEEKA